MNKRIKKKLHKRWYYGKYKNYKDARWRATNYTIVDIHPSPEYPALVRSIIELIGETLKELRK